MRLVREGDRYVAVTRYEEREIPKRGRFPLGSRPPPLVDPLPGAGRPARTVR
jgi:hypothetical protein